MDRLSPLSTPTDLLTADLVTVTLDNQKNGQCDAVSHHEALRNHTHFVHAKLQLADSSPCVKRTLPIPMPSSAYTPCLNKHVPATQMAGILRKAALRSMIWRHG